MFGALVHGASERRPALRNWKNAPSRCTCDSRNSSGSMRERIERFSSA